MQQIIQIIPLILSLSGLIVWFFKMKEEFRILKLSIQDAHDRITALEKKQGRFEGRLEEYMKETNQRIENCRESILSSVNNNMNMLLQVLVK